ncbi:MAG: M48 family metalloprotease [Saprospiraceae bacterium]
MSKDVDTDLQFLRKQPKQKTNMTVNTLTRVCCLMIVSVCLLFSSCHRENTENISPEDFTKAQRTMLGDILQRSISSITNRDHFELLPNEAPYDTTYQFIQKLYDQATSFMRLDNQSPSDNKWEDRSWPVHILVDETANAFVLPGGAFYITTGLLKSLEEEYELYYILSFEANLVHERLLLERLLSSFNSVKLSNMIARDLGPDNSDVRAVSRTLRQMNFDTDEVFSNDRNTVHSICETSQWDRSGLLSILNKLERENGWLAYRPSCSNRAEWLLDFEVVDCGTLRSNNNLGEGYRAFVLDPLE